MSFRMDFSKLPRCKARAKSRNNAPCGHVALETGTCYYHGGISSTIKHGMRMKTASVKRKQSKKYIHQAMDSIASLKSLINDSLKGGGDNGKP